MARSPFLDVTALIDAQPVSAQQYRVILLCALVVLFDGFDTQVIGYLGPALSVEWNIPRAQLGPVFSASLVGLMAGLLVIDPVSDRVGRRWSDAQRARAHRLILPQTPACNTGHHHVLWLLPWLDSRRSCCGGLARNPWLAFSQIH